MSGWERSVERVVDKKIAMTVSSVGTGNAHFALLKNSGGKGHENGTPTVRPSGCLLDCRPPIRNLRQRFLRS